MSITQAAELVRAHGRGKDSQLMHVTPSELKALQGIARAKGGSLTINPNTGLPEAGFLEDVLPTVVGIGVGALTGGAAAPFIGAAVAGLGSYAMTGSLEKGIMSGLGAFGGASALSSIGSVGAGLGTASTGAAGVAPTAAATTIGAEGLGSMAAMDVAMAGGNAAAQQAAQTAATQGIAGQMAAQGIAGNVYAPTMYDALSTSDKMSAIGKGFGQLVSDPSGTMKMLPKGFVGDALMGITPIVGGLMDSSSGMPEPEEQNAYYRPSVYDPKTQRFTTLPPVKQSDWGSQTFSGYAGSLGYAEGGEIEQRYERPIRTADPAVTDYNRALMDRAQQEYVQGMKFPVTPPAAPAAPATATPTNISPGPGGLIYDPATQRFTPAAPTQSEIDKLREEMMAMYGSQQNQGGDVNQYAGMMGVAQGGQIKRYAQGGIMSIPKFQAGGEMASDAFVIPADVVSALGNGSTDAGVKILNNYLGVAMRIEGEGDGLSDDIPASIEGSQPARVADGEVYVPPEVVARLGEGDPDEGAEKLYEMIDSIRQSAHGKKSQQREVAPEKVMPV